MGLLACGATIEQLQSRAAFDLNCPKHQLNIIELDERTRGVTGCGQQVTYIESCNQDTNGMDSNCTWVLNSDSRPRR